MRQLKLVHFTWLALLAPCLEACSLVNSLDDVVHPANDSGAPVDSSANEDVATAEAGDGAAMDEAPVVDFSTRAMRPMSQMSSMRPTRSISTVDRSKQRSKRPLWRR